MSDFLIKTEDQFISQTKDIDTLAQLNSLFMLCNQNIMKNSTLIGGVVNNLIDRLDPVEVKHTLQFGLHPMLQNRFLPVWRYYNFPVPEDVLAIVFDFLPSTHHQKVSQVDYLFHCARRKSSIYSMIRSDLEDLRFYPNLLELSITGVSGGKRNIVERLEYFFTKIPTIHTLYIENSVQYQFKSIINTVHKIANLKKLSCKIYTQTKKEYEIENLQYMAKEISKLNKLEQLAIDFKVGNVYHNWGAQVPYFLSMLDGVLPKLTHLYLKGKFEDLNVDNVNNLLKQLPHISHLVCWGVPSACAFDFLEALINQKKKLLAFSFHVLGVPHSLLKPDDPQIEKRLTDLFENFSNKNYIKKRHINDMHFCMGVSLKKLEKMGNPFYAEFTNSIFHYL